MGELNGNLREGHGVNNESGTMTVWGHDTYRMGKGAGEVASSKMLGPCGSDTALNSKPQSLFGITKQLPPHPLLSLTILT